ncbi:MAG: tetratricopeptide repeat protein [Deltaproteobacteria bacterium]|nr:tetratricopeptide repeat protein [Deltaproteobacteria bacterium]
MGRFEDSIANYKKALAIDPHFVSAYIGIGHDQILLGKGDDARATLGELFSKSARTDGERRAALFWRAVSYLHEGRYAEALGEAKKEEDIAKASKDLLSQSQDQTFMGNIALRAGNADEALAHFARSARLSAKANVPAEVKEAATRNALFNTGRAALLKGDLKTAEAQATDYAARVRKNNVRFEVWASHELLGMIALAKKNYGGALGELAQANPRDPRVTYLTAVALEGKGDTPAALDLAKKAAEYNEITNPNFAYIRTDAQKLAAKLHG